MKYVRTTEQWQLGVIYEHVNEDPKLKDKIRKLICAKNVQELRQLVASNPDLDLSRYPGNESDDVRETPIVTAMQYKHENVFLFLLQECCVNLDEKFIMTEIGARKVHATPLCLAVSPRARHLLDYGLELVRGGAQIMPDVEARMQPLDILVSHIEFAKYGANHPAKSRRLVLSTLAIDKEQRFKFASELLVRMIKRLCRESLKSLNYVTQKFQNQPQYLQFVILERLKNGEDSIFLENVDLKALPKSDISRQIVQILHAYSRRRLALTRATCS